MITSSLDRAILALRRASEKIAMAEYRAGRYKVQRRGGKVIRGYTLSPEHQLVMETLDKVSRRKISPEEAMAVLHKYDVLKARTR